jgi:hypothetical protein
MSRLKYCLRLTVNQLLRLVPVPVARGLLKSYSYQPRLQDRIRFYIQPYRYDLAAPTADEIDVTRLTQARALPNFPRDYAVFDDLLQRLAPYEAELRNCPQDAAPDAEFWFRNGAYEETDARTLYTMLRHLKPKRMIEVGCGMSSRVTTLAARKNATEGRPMSVTFVEPFPLPHLLEFPLAGPLVPKLIQDAPMELFTDLERGDVLFIDTSHVLKTQNDLCHIFHQILPALKPGVFIHFHDIFSPYDYPAKWLLDMAFHFNEQYVLEALLCNSNAFEIVLPVHALWETHHPALMAFCPADGGRPGAFWIVKN